MTALREVAASFGVAFDDDELAAGARTIDGAVGKLAELGAALGAAGIVAGAVAFGQSFATAAHEVRATATTLRVTTDELQQVRGAFELAGLSAADASGAFAAFHRGVMAAAQGGGEAAGAFWRLGVRLRDDNRQVRDSADVLNDVAARFDRVQNPARRARLATQLFGEAGLQLLPVLHAGAGGIAEMRGELEQLGGGTSAEAIEAARRYEQALVRWRLVMDGARSELAVGLLPVLTWFTDRVRTVARWFQELSRHTHVVRNVLGMLGVAGAAAGAALLVAWWPVILPFLGLAAAVGIVVLIVDDLITLFEGGDSIAGRFLDTIFGPGTARAVAENMRLITHLREAWEGVQQAIRDVGEALGLIDVDHSGQSAADRALTGSIRARAELRDEALRRNVAGAGLSAARQARLLGPATVGGTIPIEARAGAGAGGAAAVVHRPVTNHFTIATADPRAAAREAVRLMEARERDRRDAEHPLPPRDE